jgi:hypothetical protein
MVESATPTVIMLKTTQGLSMAVGWDKLTPGSWSRLFDQSSPNDLSRRIVLARLFLLRDRELGRVGRGSDQFMSTYAVLAEMRGRRTAAKSSAASTASGASSASVPMTQAITATIEDKRSNVAGKRSKDKEKKPTIPVVAADANMAKILQKLGRETLMVGVSNAAGDWIDETSKKNGATWDVRYQYLCGGVNKPGNWANWGKPKGEFLTVFLKECERAAQLPVLSYYQMVHSRPGAAGEAASNRANTLNRETMCAYLEDVRLVMQKCAKFGKPVIFHWEPDLMGYMQFNKAFKPNDPDLTTVMVRSTGLDEVKNLPDTAAGLAQAIIALRDLYAPNVLLGMHLSYWPSPSPKESADFAGKMGKWDLLFGETGDRDKGFMVAHRYHYDGGDPYRKEQDWTAMREHFADLHALLGLPLIMWQLPMGNTVMAACNNTEGHFMDQCTEYWLEDYPQNQHLAEWAQAGTIALLFGPGANGCTLASDGLKDGINNPPPIAGNRGMSAIYPDDDGGFLRISGSNYFRTGALRFLQSKDKR